jgi:hypothetical protein
MDWPELLDSLEGGLRGYDLALRGEAAPPEPFDPHVYKLGPIPDELVPRARDILRRTAELEELARGRIEQARRLAAARIEASLAARKGATGRRAIFVDKRV